MACMTRMAHTMAHMACWLADLADPRPAQDKAN